MIDGHHNGGRHVYRPPLEWKTDKLEHYVLLVYGQIDEVDSADYLIMPPSTLGYWKYRGVSTLNINDTTAPFQR